MPRFVYRVRDAGGAAASGGLSAASLDEARRVLRAEGSIIVDLHEQAGAGLRSGATGARRKRGVRRDDVIFFANQLAVMVDTGVPLPEALDSIVQQNGNSGLRSVLTDVSDQVKGGMALSAALARYPRIFSKLLVAMVRASEATGTMGAMLQRVARYLRAQRQLRKRVKGAAAYPAAMLVFCVLVVVGMLTFIIPRFERIYAGKAAVLPAPTRALLALSNALTDNWTFILACLVAAIAAGYLFFRTPRGQDALDGLRIRLPVLGSIYRRACLSRCLRTLATMVSSGVGMLEALVITGDVAGNVHYRRVWLELSDRVKEGASLSEEMFRFELIPRSISQMLAAGERAGRLGAVLDRVAGFCEEDLDISVRTVTSFVEPAMIVVIGTVVGGVALALLLPVFSLSSLVGR